MNAGDFTAKTPDDREYFAFDYARQLGTSEVISSATWTASVISGTLDTTGTGLISGTATISGSKVSQLIVGGSVDHQYCLTCKATTDRPQTLVLSGHVWVRGACD